MTKDFIDDVAEKELELECADCGEVIDRRENHCKNCGKEIRVESICPSCNKEIGDDSSFCPNCGYDFGEDNVEYDDVREISQETVKEFTREFEELYKKLLVRSTVVKYITSILREIGRYENELRIWKYCPNCGFMCGARGFFLGRRVRCIVCGAVWENKNNEEWELVENKSPLPPDSIEVGKKLETDLLDELGEQRFKQTTYKEILLNRIEDDNENELKEFEIPERSSGRPEKIICPVCYGSVPYTLEDFVKHWSDSPTCSIPDEKPELEFDKSWEKITEMIEEREEPECPYCGKRTHDESAKKYITHWTNGKCDRTMESPPPEMPDGIDKEMWNEINEKWDMFQQEEKEEDIPIVGLIAGIILLIFLLVLILL